MGDPSYAANGSRSNGLGTGDLGSILGEPLRSEDADEQRDDDDDDEEEEEEEEMGVEDDDEEYVDHDYGYTPKPKARPRGGVSKDAKGTAASRAGGGGGSGGKGRVTVDDGASASGSGSGSLQVGGEYEDGGHGGDEYEPLYVNAKQYHRIMKRRVARARLEEMGRLSRERKVSRSALDSEVCILADVRCGM